MAVATQEEMDKIAKFLMGVAVCAALYYVWRIFIMQDLNKKKSLDQQLREKGISP